MNSNILNYDQSMDEQVAALLNEAWARLRALPHIYVKEDRWPVVNGELLAQWREKGRLTQEGTFVAKHDDGSLGAIFSVSAVDEGKGTLHFFGVHPDQTGRGYGSRTLAAAEEYLRSCGVGQIVTEPIDSRCPIINSFMRTQGYEVPNPEQHSIIMVLGPEGRKVRPVTLPDDSYSIVTWRDEYLDDWVHIRNVAFGQNTDATPFLEQFRNRPDFDPDAWFFMRHQDRLVGITGALECRNPDGSHRGGQLEWVGVLPEYRGKKLGEALVMTALNRLIQREIEPIALITQPVLQSAVGLYKKLGFHTPAQLLRYHKQL